VHRARETDFVDRSMESGTFTVDFSTLSWGKGNTVSYFVFVFILDAYSGALVCHSVVTRVLFSIPWLKYSAAAKGRSFICSYQAPWQAPLAHRMDR